MLIKMHMIYTAIILRHFFKSPHPQPFSQGRRESRIQLSDFLWAKQVPSPRGEGLRVRAIQTGTIKLTCKRAFLSLAIVICFIPFAFCQKTPSGSIQLIARSLKDSIWLRWAPDSYNAWQLGNKYGYKVVRYTLLRDSLLLKKPEFQALTKTSLKPLPLYDWEPLVKQDKYAAIAAQALYGKKFVVDPGKGFDVEQIRTRAMEQKQRFSFALYAADMSPLTAKASALWFTDKTVKTNEKYLYRVMIDIPRDSVRIDTAFIFTGPSDYSSLPKPLELKAQFGDRMVKLSWNSFVHNKLYVGYMIERSEDGENTFIPVNREPVINLMPKEDSYSEYSYKIDSLSENNKEYRYRVRGVTSFGELGAWSDTVKGKGIENITATPNFTKYEIVNGAVRLYWEYPDEARQKITGFAIFRSTNDKTGYKLMNGKITSSETTFLDGKPLMTAYYKVVAWRDTTIQRESFPYLVQLTDSIPPQQPKGLTGKADTSGIISLAWQPNTDEDIYGYRVFRSASGNDEYSQLTHAPIPDTFYVDTVSKVDLNAFVFYKIIAIDNRQNESKFSQVLKVVKPDIIPPSIPVIKSIKATLNGIDLIWINSISADVTKHEVYRKYNTDTAWINIASFQYDKAKETAYSDKDASPDKVSKYKIVAVDTVGNTSDPAISIEVKALKPVMAAGIGKITQQLDSLKGHLTLLWDLPGKKVQYFKVYRRTKETPYVMYVTLPGNDNRFEDYKLKAGNLYAYRIKVIYEDGSISGLSEEVKIQF